MLLFYTTYYAVDYNIIDSLINMQEYTNVLDILNNKKQIDSLGLVYKLICLNQLNKKEFKKSYEKIFKEKKEILQILNICELLENQKLDKAYTELNKIKSDKFRFWIEARKWELELLSKKTAIPIFQRRHTKSINDSLLSKLYYFDQFIYLYGNKDKKNYLDKINDLSLKFPDIPKVQLVNYLLAKKENNYFNMDYSFQMLWKYRKNKYKNFLNYTEIFLKYYILFLK